MLQNNQTRKRAKENLQEIQRHIDTHHAHTGIV